MAEKRDFYRVLGVGRGASADELKKAYRRLAKEHHPDRNPGDKEAEKTFKEVNEAYDILKDAEKRAAYDRFGHGAFEGGGPGPGGFGGRGGFGGGPFGGAGAGGFGDIFEEMFGAGFAGARAGAGGGGGRGGDLRFNMEITLEDAFKGKKAQVRVPAAAPCGTCKGAGAKPGTQPASCQTCNGRGRVRSQSGFFTVERTCPACAGQGEVIKDPCADCGGSGRVKKEKTLSVNIPPGIDDGARIRLSGEGEAGLRGAPAGDLYIFIGVRRHSFFQRDGADIHCRVPIPMTTAALGGAVEIPTVEGKRARVSVPAGTPGGHQFRMRGKGMTALDSQRRGDMFVHVSVETPVNLNKRQKELLEQFAREGRAEDTSPEAHGFFSKVKDLWDDLTE